MSEPHDVSAFVAISQALAPFEGSVALHGLTTALAVWAVETNSSARIVAALIQGIEIAELQKEQDLHQKATRAS